jgi:hypothetical protein
MSELCTTRLALREFRDSDVDSLYEIQGNREHMRYTFWAESRAACERWLRRYEDARRVNGFAPWTIVHRLEERVMQMQPRKRRCLNQQSPRLGSRRSRRITKSGSQTREWSMESRPL